MSIHALFSTHRMIEGLHTYGIAGATQLGGLGFGGFGDLGKTLQSVYAAQGRGADDSLPASIVAKLPVIEAKLQSEKTSQASQASQAGVCPTGITNIRGECCPPGSMLGPTGECTGPTELIPGQNPNLIYTGAGASSNAATIEDNTTTYALIGVGVLGLFGLGYYLMKK